METPYSGDELLKVAQAHVARIPLPPDMAEDMVQEFALGALQAAQNGGRSRAYLRKAGIWAVKSSLRERGRWDKRIAASIEALLHGMDQDDEEERRVPQDPVKANVQGANPEIDPVEQLLAKERSERLWAAVTALPMLEQRLVTLHYSEGIPLVQAAEQLEISTRHATRMLASALAKLRERLGEDFQLSA